MDFKDLRDAPNNNGTPPMVTPPHPVRRRVSPVIIILSALSGLLLVALTAVTTTFVIYRSDTTSVSEPALIHVTQPVNGWMPQRAEWAEGMENWVRYIEVWADNFADYMTTWADDFTDNWDDLYWGISPAPFDNLFGNFNMDSWSWWHNNFNGCDCFTPAN